MPDLSPSQDFERWLADLALAVTVYCARNTVIENYHAGMAIRSKTGDFSDVSIKTPFGEIPWSEASRISDEEMKAFNIEVSNKIFTTLQYLLNPAFEAGQEEFVQRLSHFYPTRWNRPIMQALQSPKGQTMNPTKLTDQIKEVKAKQSFTSVAEAQVLVDALTKKHNRAPLDDFDGLSPEQMTCFLVAPYGSPGLAEFASCLTTEPTGPAIMLFGILAEAIRSKGLSLTATGNLPVKLARGAAQNIMGETGYQEYTRLGSLRSETDYSDLYALRLTSELGKLIRKYKGRFLLSAECRGILARQGLAGVYPRLLRTYATAFDWGNRDLYPDLFIIQRSFLFTLWLLDRYGAEWRPNSFYEDLFLKAFPQALAEVNSDLDDLPERTVRRSYSLRCLDRFAGFFGLAEIDLSPDDFLRSNFQIRKTTLLNDVVRFPASGK